MKNNQTQEKTWKKKNIPLVKFGIDHGLDTIEGIFLKIKKLDETTDSETGEIKDRHTALFQKPDSDEKFQVWANAGLKSAISSSDVLEGEHVRIVHLGKVKRTGKAGEVNQYDIFSLS